MSTATWDPGLPIPNPEQSARIRALMERQTTHEETP